MALDEQRAFPKKPLRVLPIQSRRGLGSLRRHLVGRVHHALVLLYSAKHLAARMKYAPITLAGQPLSPEQCLILHGALLLLVQQQDQEIASAQEMLDALQAAECEEQSA